MKWTRYIITAIVSPRLFFYSSEQHLIIALVLICKGYAAPCNLFGQFIISRYRYVSGVFHIHRISVNVVLPSSILTGNSKKNTVQIIHVITMREYEETIAVQWFAKALNKQKYGDMLLIHHGPWLLINNCSLTKYFTFFFEKILKQRGLICEYENLYSGLNTHRLYEIYKNGFIIVLFIYQRAKNVFIFILI